MVSEMWGAMKLFFIALFVLFIVQSLVIGLYHDISGSMDDTMVAGDAFVVLNFWYGVRLPFMKYPIIAVFKPQPGEILVFRYPLDERQIHVKRIIAVGGQTVSITAKQVYVDGFAAALPSKGKNADPVIFPRGEAGSGKRDYAPLATIPESSVYVLGDNRDFSLDSRIWGYLPVRNIQGRVWFVLWSIDPEKSWLDIRHKIRWERVFQRVR
jgi:signal peptidase I